MRFPWFSVPTLGSAAFNNAGDIANIFSRVTGSSISSIDGLISANGAANLFLINPNGIIFGENASLNLGGSFFASTADSLLFEGNTEFSASNPQAPPLLKVSIPIGANFRNNTGDITVNQSILEVSTGENLALVGGNLSIEGGELGLIAAPGGRIELGGLTEAGEVGINENNSLTFPENVARGNITLSNLALINVSSDGEGFIAVNANNLELLGASSLEGGIASDLGNSNAQAGNINLNATGEISLKQSSQVVNRVNENAIGNSGDINIQTGSLTVLEESLLSASAFGQGNAGDITINATDGVTLNTQGSIDAAITLGGQGNAGEITINAGKKISLDGSLTSIASSLTFATGRGGKIKITGESLNLDNGAVIDAGNTFSQGAGGNIQIDVSDSVSLQSGASIVSNSSGSGGDGAHKGRFFTLTL
jgi:filamentous hemagglutinin family protein